MKAAPEAQLRLLDLQELDARLDRLAHRRRTLAELAEIAKVEERLGGVDDALVAAQTEISDIDREQKKAEQDVDQVRARADRDQKRLDSGQVSSARDLENLQSEIASLQKRQSDLEEIVLDVMERREEAENRLRAVEADKETAEKELAELSERRDTAHREIDGEAELVRTARAGVVGDIPDDLLKLYEKLREQHRGVAAAALLRGQCQGCHLQLNTVELNAIRTAVKDDVIRCEECRRILVRTPESGL
ncbi:C4-type zinc ribbon domain-containing protein [Actinoallomurus purpureus]|uniref:zinc ribbon domain-containing protein n=1 Tax=Actinoallomurus purpureus TaxID=478114 RepID=UPI002092A956|nr:C4-type zinc ribbon domain-containing protein [Actinoallomurus purpureus]MCO6011150.1 C4-type zinc ribbon domain-containing protein [Actinoallomurus purpureus]